MSRVELRIFTEPQQGATYETLLRVAQAAEQFNYGAFFRSDHYLKMGSVDGLPGPTDAWITLAGLARETRSIRLGTLMTSASFRLPGVLAIQVAQVDAMSGGRVELGLGTGWYRDEHTAYGIPFPEKRFDRLDEQLTIITGLWATKVGDTFDFAGDHYRITESPGLPKPVQERVPILVGGMGPKRTPVLAARYATEYNLPFVSIEQTKPQIELVRTAVKEHGRQPDELVYSNALVACVGQDDAEVGRRARAIGREVAELKTNGLAGSPAEVVDKIGRYAEAGTQRIYLQILDLHDLEHLELIASQVMIQLD